MCESKLVWGLDIGGTKTAFITGDLQGNVLSRCEVATKAYPTREAVLEAVLPESGDPLCIGVSCGGPLDEDRGLILSPPNLPGWDEARTAIEQYVGSKRGYKKNKYQYEPRTRELVEKHWKFALEQWGYEL